MGLADDVQIMFARGGIRFFDYIVNCSPTMG